MNRREEQKIREFFKREAGGQKAPDDLKERIDREISRIAAENAAAEKTAESERKVVNMRFKKRKMALIAAAIVVVGSITCFATGQIAGVMTGSSRLTEVHDYRGLADAEKKAGIETGMPEVFSNGYQFKSVNTSDGQAVDAEGNGIPGTEFTDVAMVYEKDGSELDVFISPRRTELEGSGEEGQAVTEARKIGGVSVEYIETTMKVVPPDYELTEQDKKDLENPNFGISYGSEAVEVNHVRSLEWKTEDKIYNILDITGTVDADTMFSMAEDVIEGK